MNDDEKDDNGSDGFKLLMPFINQHPAYAYGFECGRLWERMARGEKMEHESIHAENKEQIELMCLRFLYDFEIGVEVDGWCSLNAFPNRYKYN